MFWEASLYELNNPENEIGRLKTPFLSCKLVKKGKAMCLMWFTPVVSIIHNGNLIVPYAMSDFASTYATINLNELLNELKNSK